MKNVNIFFFILTLNVGFSQIDSLTLDLLPSSYDSVVFSVWDVQTKETGMPLNIFDPINSEVDEYERELGRTSLSLKDSKSWIKKISKKSSYAQSRALIYHYNVVFELHKKGQIITTISISTMNKNIDIRNLQNDQFFRNSCSKRLKKALVSLLKKYSFMEYIDEFDLW